jgi:hypothetical protein
METLGLMHLPPDDALQALIAGQPDDVIDAVILAPGQQRLAAEAGIGSEHDFHFGPALAQLPHDARDLLDRTGSRILVGRSEAGAQQLITGENIMRQIAVAVVIAMEEALRLMTIERDVSGVQIEHDLVWHGGLRLDE